MIRHFLLEGSTTFLATTYFKLLLCLRKCTRNIWFLNNCINYNLTPKYMSLKTNNTSAAAKKAVALGLRKWIIEERKI